MTKRYRQRAVVDAVTFTVRQGKVTGFLGRNGAGKSTTLRMILGLTRPDGGSALLAGRRYQDVRYPARQVGALLESSVPQRSMTVAGHLRWVAQSNRIDRGRIAEVLDLVDLSEAAGRRVGALSLGMTQRLGLASALLGDPPVLILDEPTNGLDAEGIRWLRELLRGMAADGRTVFLSSHLMAEMSMVADHLIVIHRGRLLADTSVADMVAQHARSYVRIRTPEPGRLSRELAANGGSAALAADDSLQVKGLTAAEIIRVAVSCGIALGELSTGSGSLEDAFLDMTAVGERAS
ncbi:MAG: ABC transporter ATP-binding protein [Trebonia sp.]